MGHKMVYTRDSLDIQMQYSDCIITWVPPWEVFRILRAMLFYRTAFLIKETSEFNKLMACLLSFKSCWINLVKTSMWLMTSSIPSEWTNIMSKCSFHWKTDWTYSVHVKDWLAGTFIKATHRWPWAQGKYIVHLSNQYGESQSHKFVP